MAAKWQDLFIRTLSPGAIQRSDPWSSSKWWFGVYFNQITVQSASGVEDILALDHVQGNVVGSTCHFTSYFSFCDVGERVVRVTDI